LVHIHPLNLAAANSAEGYEDEIDIGNHFRANLKIRPYGIIMSKRYIDFLIVPEGNSKSYKFKLSYFATWLIAGLVAVILLVAIVFNVWHGELVYRIFAGKSLVQENERLKRYNARVVELEKELKDYKNFVSRVANLAGVKYEEVASKQLAYLPEKPEAEGNKISGPSENRTDLGVSSTGEGLIKASLNPIPANVDSLKHVPTGVPVDGWVTKGFSVNNPQLGGNHPGVDFAAKIGTKVKATADGKVASAGWDDVYGNVVTIDHGNGYVTYYGHNLKVLVKVGDTVHRGDVIALSGSSGRSSAPHLHYEIKQNGTAVDPKDYLNQR
jgi:murein DD-endopeptidase MepM/ murein hydrolase activator NlpD